MLINNVDIEKFNARILNVNIQNSSMVNDLDLNSIKTTSFGIFNNKIALNSIKVELLINSLDKKQYYIDKSNLLNNMLQEFEVFFEDRDLRFKCILLKHIDQASTRQIRGVLALELLAYNLEKEVIETLDKVPTKTFNVSGNTRVPVVVEIVSPVDVIDLKLEGLTIDPITIKNLKANKKIIINGEDGTSTQDGINKFKDMDMWEFPTLDIGTNTIKLSRDNCNVTIKYKPRYL